jgi:hypothetical protein
MKKFLLGILTIFYFGVSTGATLQVHYCMGKMVDVDLVNKDSNHCHKCGMTKMNGKKGCCHDEQKVIKIAGDQNSTDVAYQMVQLPSVAIIKNYAELSAIAISSSLTENNTRSNSLFRDSQAAVYLLNCDFRI